MEMTDKRKFLKWCDENEINVKERRLGGGCIEYNINPDHKAVIVVQGVTLKMNRVQDWDKLTALFDAEGRCLGGTPQLANTGLPWRN